METISNVVNTVSDTVTKAIYGDQPTTGNETAGNEPVSGAQGKGTLTEPYDKGNSEDPTDPTTRNETAGAEPVSGLQGKGTTTEPFDKGNSADATNTTSLPIREKSALDNNAGIPDLSAKPTIPTSDAFNSATAANASTLAQPSTFTTQESSTSGATLGHGSIGQGDAGVNDTKNLADTLSKTDNSPGIASTVSGTDGPKTPGLAGFGDKPSISPSDESQLPKVVSGISSSADTSSKAIGAGDAGASGTQNLSETLAKTEGSATEAVTSGSGSGSEGKHDAPFAGTTSANAQQAVAPAAAPIDIGSSTTSTATKPSVEKEADRVVESTHKDTATKDTTSSGNSGLATHTKSESPSGEKEKVSKMEKLKEKLHIGHKH